MKTFPAHALSRRYELGWPRPRIKDSGTVSMRLGNGTLRTRDELGQDIVAQELRYLALTEADTAILDAFRAAHRGGTKFYWPDPMTYLTYEARYDPATPPVIVPSSERPETYDAEILVLPKVPTVAVDMLVAHYKLNDNADDTTVADATGNGHTGSASANTSTLTVAGKIDTALEFVSASSRYVQVADHADLRLTDGGTICFWCKWDGTRDSTGGAAPTMISRDTYWRIWVAAADGRVGLITQTGAANQAHSGSAVLTSGVWRHVAVSWCAASQSRRIFLDGLDVTAESGDGSMPGESAANVHIGAYATTGGYFGGALDDVRIYKRPLTTVEIQAIYNGGSGTEEAIVA